MAKKSPEERARQLVEDLKLHSGSYKKYALEARKDYIELWTKQNEQVKHLYERIAESVQKKIEDMPGNTATDKKRKEHLKGVLAYIDDQGDKLNGALEELTEDHVKKGADIAINYNNKISYDLFKDADVGLDNLDKLYSKMNDDAVKAIYAKNKNGMKLSDRIWQTSKNARNSMKELVENGVAEGIDSKELAEALEGYIKKGRSTLAKDYPNMMKRMPNRVPKTISYEAVRLARTEMSAAFGEGTIASSNKSPSYKGMKWVLSDSHDVKDVCDELAAADHGLGAGVYPPGEEPSFPAHPNDLCTLVPVHEEPEDFVDKLKEWYDDPDSHPDIEDWYQNTYKESIAD